MRCPSALVAILICASATMPAQADDAAPPAVPPRTSVEFAAYTDATLSSGWADFAGSGTLITNVHHAAGLVIRLPDAGPELRVGALFDIYLLGASPTSTFGLEVHAGWTRPSGWTLGARTSVARGVDGEPFEDGVITVGARARHHPWLLGADLLIPLEAPRAFGVVVGAGYTGRGATVTLIITVVGLGILYGLGNATS